MLEESEARAQILDATPAPSSHPVDLAAALGSYAAETVRASVALPGFDNSQMDGYAVRAQDATKDAELTISGEQAAGPDRHLKVEPGMAVRIFTGAPMPEGADAVVMQEDTEILSKGTRIRIVEGVETREFVRRRGSDLCEGQTILSSGERINAGIIGILASQGCARLPIYRQPRCSVVSTGDELLPPGHDLGPGQLYDSNGAMLQAMAQEWGAAVSGRFHATDDPGKLRDILGQALSDTDYCIVAGGVSVGDHDHVKQILSDLGVEGGFWKVRIKPGKPLYFGRRDQTLVFGLPGNPVSAYITFLLFVLPSLLKAQGKKVSIDTPSLPSWRTELSAPLSNPGDRPHYVRGRWSPERPFFVPGGVQQSHALFSLSRSNALVRVEGGETLEAGTQVLAYGVSPFAAI